MANLVKIIVLPNELLQLRLDVHDALRRELKLHERNPSFFQMLQEPDLRRLQKHETAAFARPSCCASNSVNVISRVIRWVKLHDPINSRNLLRSQPSSDSNA